ncbi:MAG: electron transport complex subunit RsxC [Mariprofundaceae bacterium]
MRRTLLDQLGLDWQGFPGGVHPDQDKLSAVIPIGDCPLPSALIVPMKQHIGEACSPLVDVGETVKRGQKIARAQGYVSAPVHAPTSGKVVKIEEHPIPHPSGLGMPCMFIEPDGKDEWETGLDPWPDYRERDAGEVRDRIRLCGVVGLGGAVFPTFIKLIRDKQHPIETVIINGIECEPYLTNDHRLMLEEADSIISGLDVMMHIAGAVQAVIAIEDNKPDAVETMQKVIDDLDRNDTVNISVLPTKYPQGSEKQLIRSLIGREVPAGKLPMHVGVLCQNAATAKSIHEAVVLGRPLTERVVTVSGDAIKRPGNARVRIGTSIRHVFAQHGVMDFDGGDVLHGGPMMGERLLSVDVPVVKSSTGLLFMHNDSMNEAHVEPQSCIRCGHCVEVCPASLVPNDLARFCKHDQFDKAQEYHLFDCIECGCCSYVCPSNIPLVHYYRYAKGQVSKISREKSFAELSRIRTEAREARIAHEKAERAARRSRVRAEHKPADRETQKAPSAEDTAGDQA